jgi:hypothetical protein
VQHDRHPGLRELPGGFGPGKAAADNMYRLQPPFFHSTITRPPGSGLQRGPGET